ncbi:MAG: hypothetical protein IK121_03130, partial [Lachnospiraceae bacterium]|nr:hypothetical protein [Lachnospiraceae bacterium]
GHIADYLGEVGEEDRLDIIDSYKDCMINKYPDYITVTKNTITFKKGFRDMFAEKILTKIKELVEKATVESLSHEIRWRIEELLGDQFGLYIYMDNGGYIRENVFLLEEVREGEPYYFGNVIDYHY